MTEITPKILNEFSLMPGGNAQLQAYLDANYAQLCREYGANLSYRSTLGPAMKGLVKLLDSVLPDEAKTRLKDVLKSHSDYVVVIHDLPERKGLENDASATSRDAQMSYSFFLGSALYEKYDMDSRFSTVLKRATHRAPEKEKTDTYETHRDLNTHHIILAAPYNGEHALTNFIQVAKAAESVPPEKRSKIIVSVNRNDCTLDEALVKLKKLPDTLGGRWVGMATTIALSQEQPDPQAAQLFTDALKAHTASFDLQPGSLAVICEDRIFHSSQRGDAQSIALIPAEQAHSRVLIHNAGKTIGKG